MNKRILWALSVGGGILTGLAWTNWFSGLVLLISFVPFFYVEHFLFENREGFHRNSVFIYLLPGFLVFNIIAIGWVHVASLVAAVFLITASTFFMAFIFWLAHLVRLKAGDIPGIIALIAFWLSFEFRNLNSDLFHPWLNLGNGLAKDIQFIQWYDITGTAGGTLWILVSNISINILIIRKFKDLKYNYLRLLLLIIILIVPISLSLYKFKKFGQNDGIKTEVVLIQPNIDPYSEKFKTSFEVQLDTVLKMAEAGITDNTKWVIAPETTIDDPIDESDFKNNKYIIQIQKFLSLHPGVTIIIGATSLKFYQPSESGPPSTAIKMVDSDLYYDIYNSALQIDTGKQVAVYHKSKLVLGVEKQFTGFTAKLMNLLLPYFGGTQSGYSIQKERTVFENRNNNQEAAPIICYESVFGEFVGEYVKNGADFLVIITNDGWWKNTIGYRQHLSYASLRAIETRRSVARAANTGISCIMDKRGVILSSTEWWKPAILRGEVDNEDLITFYVKNGDYILRAGNMVSILLLIIIFIAIPLWKKFKPGNKII